jgi:hypothetical protein
MEEKYFVLKMGRSIWYLQKGDKIYFYDEISRKEEVSEVVRIHTSAKEVKDPPAKVVEIFKKYVK